MKLNKGAMFGLDARIALAIFGVLSIISGAALYNAIQQARVTAFVTDLNEAIKGIEQYMLDTGQDLPIDSTETQRFDMEALVEDSGVSGWNGPYYSKQAGIDNLYLDTNIGVNLGACLVSDDDFPTSTTFVDCSANKNCYSWILVHNVPENIALAADEIIDGGDGALTGKLRLHLTGSVRHVYLQGPLLLKRF